MLFFIWGSKDISSRLFLCAFMIKVSFKVMHSLNILGIGKGYTQGKEGGRLILRYRNAAAHVSSLIYIVSLQWSEVLNTNSYLDNRFQRLQGPENCFFFSFSYKRNKSLHCLNTISRKMSNLKAVFVQVVLHVSAIFLNRGLFEIMGAYFKMCGRHIPELVIVNSACDVKFYYVGKQ